MDTHHEHETKFKIIQKKTMYALWVTWKFITIISEDALESIEANWHIVRREADLFFGSIVLLIGIFSFHNGKNCDGNTAEYLSCTRPSTFYYFSGFEIFLIIVGAFFLLLWVSKKNSHSRAK